MQDSHNLSTAQKRNCAIECVSECHASIAPPVHLEVVPDPPDDGEAGDEDGVAVVALHGLLAEFEEARQAAETEQLVAHRRVDAKSERLIRS